MKLRSPSNSISILTLLFLTATFEHNYSTLRVFSGDFKWMQINISAISTAFLVLGIDFSILMSIIHLVSESQVIENKWPARLILFMSVSLSGALNVRYMLVHAPDESFFSTFVAICVGAFIPIMLLLLGWLSEATPNKSNVTKNSTHKIINKRIRQRLANAKPLDSMEFQSMNKKLSPLEQRIFDELQEDFNKSNRTIARKVGCSPTTVSKVRKKLTL